MANIAPTLTPLPLITMGIPQISPPNKNINDKGKKMRSGLKSITILTISIIVSNAVLRLIVLLPVLRGCVVIGVSITKFLSAKNESVITSLKAIELGHNGKYFRAKEVL